MAITNLNPNSNGNTNSNIPNGNISTGAMPNVIPTGQTSSSTDITNCLINYNEKFKTEPPAMFRDEIIYQTMGVLIGKNKPNALLVGPAGVGKTKIAEDIARRIVNQDKTVPDKLRNSVIYELPLSSIVAGAGVVGQLEERISEIIAFASDPKNDAILFIDEIHQLIDGNQIYDKIAQILKPAMARGDLRIIGATTTNEASNLMDDPAFNRRFSRIIIDELTRQQTVEILISAKPSYIMHHKNKILIDDSLLEVIATVADEYLSSTSHRPDTALTLLDRACGDAIIARQLKEVSLANDPHLLALLTSNPTVPLTERQVRKTAMLLMTGHAKENIFDKEILREQLSVIKGQDDVLDIIIEALSHDSSGYFPRTTPLTFLFAGASGVGKTEVTKIIAKHITGMKPITLNMSEYHNPASINRIIGSPAGYVGSDSHAELPFDILESNPYQIILLDEFEKADRSVQRLFMSAFDEGYIKTSKGRTIDFSKAIIIATTNAGYTKQSSRVGFSVATNKENPSKLTRELSSYFDVELLNRFTKMLRFNGITKEHYRIIIKEQYAKEIARIKSSHRNITLADELTDDELDTIVSDSYIEEFGARPAKKVVRQFIETHI